MPSPPSTVNNTPKLPVFYNDNQTVRDNVSFSQSARKPEQFVARHRDNSKVEIISDWQPLTPDELASVHDPAHVNAVLAGTARNGFGNTLASVAASLPWTNGSFYRAAQHAFKHRTVAMSPTSGFHHAGYRTSEGFCTFNGLMVAAALLHKNEGVRRVGIIDFDAHYGNGTDDIIDTLKIDYVEHESFGAYAEPEMVFYFWLVELENRLMDKFKNCDILFYQAGADPHINDILGGFLTTLQMELRDRIVFMVAKRLNLPIVWNLAGGYQSPFEDTMRLHDNTMDACLMTFYR